ncbi:hypothetical protein EBU24_03240 [bacterium]|nr:hypothetical protein [bacterium]
MNFEKDCDKFSEEMSKIESIYDEFKPPEILRFYFNTLKNFDIDVVVKSIEIHVVTSKFYPRPSELMDLCKEEKNKISRNLKSKVVALPSVDADPLLGAASSMTAILMLNKNYNTSDQFLTDFIEKMGGLNEIKNMIKPFFKEILYCDYSCFDSFHRAHRENFISARNVILKALVEHSKRGEHILEMIDEAENIRQIFGGK